MENSGVRGYIWVMFSPTVARIIAFAVAAWVFIGLMLLVAYFVAAPLRDWYGDVAQQWPAGGHLLFIGLLVVIPLWLSRVMRRRDQRRNDRAAL